MPRIGPFDITDAQLRNVKTGAIVVADVAASFASPELLLTAAGIAAVIKLADRKGLLESEQAKPLKELARQIDRHVKLDHNLLLNSLPLISKLKLLDKLFPNSATLGRVRTGAELAAKSASLRRIVERFGKGPHEGPAAGVGPTTPIGPQKPTGPDLN